MHRPRSVRAPHTIDQPPRATAADGFAAIAGVALLLMSLSILVV